MNKEDFAYIGCKLLALYWLVNAFHLLASFASSMVSFNTDSSATFNSDATLYLAYLPLVAYLLFAIIFWFGAKRFTKAIFSGKYENDSKCVTKHHVQSIAFSTVGLILIFISVPELINVLYKIHMLKELDSYTQVQHGVKAQIIELSLKVIFGILLFFGSRGLSGLLYRIREAGIK